MAAQDKNLESIVSRVRRQLGKVFMQHDLWSENSLLKNGASSKFCGFEKPKAQHRFGTFKRRPIKIFKGNSKKAQMLGPTQALQSFEG